MTAFPLHTTALLFALAALAATPVPAIGQAQNCSLPAGAGGTLGHPGGNVLQGELSPDPMRTGESSGLDLVEYLFVDPNDLVTDPQTGTTGPNILFANTSGRVDPVDLGLGHGDEFCVFSLSFSLGVLQAQIDTLYNGEFSGVPCCDFAELVQGVDVCSIMVATGILEGADVTNAQELRDFAVAYGVAPTLEAIVYLVDSVINVIPPGQPCTSGFPMCYAYSNRVCFTVIDPAIHAPSVQGSDGIANVRAGPNPAPGDYAVRFDSGHPGDAVWRLHDPAGRAVRRGRATVRPGTNQLRFDLAGLPAGTYLLRIDHPAWNFRLRIVRGGE